MVWGIHCELKNERSSFASNGVVSVDNRNIEITFDEQSFDQDGIASCFLKENDITITLHKVAAKPLSAKPSVDSNDGQDAPTSTPIVSKEIVDPSIQNGTQADTVGSEEKAPPGKGVVGIADQEIQAHKPVPVSAKTFRTMLFDNVSWKEPHSMTLEEFSALNRKMRYGEVRELKEEVVDFEAGRICVSTDGISVDTAKWNPPKGGSDGQFHIELPMNEIRLSLFVFRPVSELLSFKEVSKEVPYPKIDEDFGRGSGGAFKWVYASTRGPSHRNSDRLCRDDDIRVWHDHKTDTLYLVVADGAGSANYAREGSRIAVEGMINYFKEKPLCSGMLNSSNGCLEAKKEIHRAVLNSVLARIDERCREISAERSEPNLTRRSLHTTLNFAVIQRGLNDESNVLTFAIGDGAVLFCKNDGTCRRLSVPDRGEFASQTAFITSSGSIPPLESESSLKFYECRFNKATISAGETDAGYLALMTDGVSEDLEDWGGFLKVTGQIMKAMDASALLEWLNLQVERNLDDKTIVLASQSQVVR